MARVTLADLAAPLKKIEKYTEQSEATLQVVEELVYAGQTIQGAILKELEKQTKILQLGLAGGIGAAVKKKKAASAGAGAGAKGATKEMGGLAEGLEAIGIGAKGLAAGIFRFLLVPKKAVTNFLAVVKDVFAVFSDPKIDPKKIKQSSKAFKRISESIWLFAKSLAKATLVLPLVQLGIDTFLQILKKVMDKFRELKKPDKIEAAAEALLVVSESILEFSKALAISALLLIPGMFAIPLLFISIKLVTKIFIGMGKNTAKIKKGGEALKEVGLGIRNFAIGLALFALATMFIFMNPLVLLGMVVSLILISSAVWLIGKMDKRRDITKGSKVLKGMGLGLALFGIGYAVFAWAVGSPKWEDILKQVAVLAGISLVIVLLGKLKSQVLQGILMFLGIGASMIVFSMGYVPFAKALKGVGWNEFAIQMAVLGGVGLIMAGMGALVAASMGLILLGPLMYIAIGYSLEKLAEGLIAFKRVDWSEEESMNLGIILAGLKTAFMGGKENDGFFSKIGSVFTGALDAGIIIESALGYMAIGEALTSLSKGLIDFQKVHWTEDDTITLTTMLGGISAAFSAAGGEPQSPGGVLGFVFGNTFSPNKVERGIDSVMDAGKALINIVKGLRAYLDLMEEFGSEPFAPGGVLEVAVGNTLGFISTAFSAIGQDEVSDSWLFFEWDENNVQKGIRAVRGAGDAMTDIVKGLRSYLELLDQTGGVETFEEGGDLNRAVGLTLGFVSAAFSAIGSQETEDSWLFFSWDENTVEKGIDAVDNAGARLTEIVKGLQSFLTLIDQAGGIETFEDGGDLNKAVSLSLGFISAAFSAIGADETEDSWLFFSWDENNVEKGIDAVKGAGEELINIAKGLNVFVETIELAGGIASFEEGGKLNKAVSLSLGFISAAFSAIGADETTDSWLFFSWDENNVEKGIDAIKGAGDELTNIALGLKEFQGLVETDLDFAPDGRLAEAVGKSVTFIAEAFKAVGMEEETDGWFVFSWDENLVQKGIKAVKGAGTELKDIALGLKEFQGLVESDLDFQPSGRLAEAVGESVTFIARAFKAIGEEEASDDWFTFSWNKNLVAKGIEAVEGAGSALLDIATGLKEFQTMIEKDISFAPGAPLANAINGAMGMIGTGFGFIGGMKETKEVDMGWISFSWEENLVKKGIENVEGAGAALTDIASGLVSYIEMIDDKVDFPTLLDFVEKTLGVVGTGFGMIGGQTVKTGEGWFGIEWNENAVQVGIKSVKGADKALTTIAMGLITYVAMLEDDMDFNQLLDFVSGTLGIVGRGFADIGAQNQMTGYYGITWDENLVQKGIIAVKGADARLKEIGLSLTDWVTMTETGLDFEKMNSFIGQTLGMVGGAFAEIGGANTKKQVLWFEWDENIIQKGIAAVAGVGARLIEIGKGVAEFANLPNPKVAAEAIAILFESTGKLFDQLGRKPFYGTGMWAVQSFWVSMAEVGSDSSLEKAAKDMGLMAKNINSLEINKLDGLAALMVEFRETADEMDGWGFFSDMAEGIGKMAEGFNNFFQPSTDQVADAEAATSAGEEGGGMALITKELKRLNGSMAQMNRVLANLPEDISQIKLKLPNTYSG